MTTADKKSGLQDLSITLRRLALTAAVVLSVGFPSNPADAALHSGVVELFPGDGWDFSDSLITGIPADFLYIVTALRSEEAKTRDFSDILAANAPAGILYVGNADSTYENLATAPTDPGLYAASEVAFEGDVFVVRTQEAHYAKMRIVSFGSLIKFEYVYQDDGTPELLQTTPVESKTWGGVKALYR